MITFAQDETLAPDPPFRIFFCGDVCTCPHVFVLSNRGALRTTAQCISSSR